MAEYTDLLSIVLVSEMVQNIAGLFLVKAPAKHVYERIHQRSKTLHSLFQRIKSDVAFFNFLKHLHVHIHVSSVHMNENTMDAYFCLRVQTHDQCSNFFVLECFQSL